MYRQRLGDDRKTTWRVPLTAGHRSPPVLFADVPGKALREPGDQTWAAPLRQQHTLPLHVFKLQRWSLQWGQDDTLQYH